MQPKRIASLLASGTEILYALGLGDRIVAVSHECDWPGEVADKPRVTFTRVSHATASRVIDEQVRGMLAGGASLYAVDMEQLETLRPDLIVTQAQCDVCAVRYDDVVEAVERSKRLHGTRVVALNPTRLEEVFRDMLLVGDAAAVFDQAKLAVTGLRARVERIRHTASKIAHSARPRVVCVEWVDPLMVAANWTPELVELTGGRHELTKTGMHSQYTRWDDVLAYQPEVIVVAPCGFDLARSQRELPLLADRPGWNALPAVRDGRVYVCDGNAYFNRSGPRLVDTLELLAHLIHPTRFAEPEWSRQREPVWRKVSERAEALAARP